MCSDYALFLPEKMLQQLRACFPRTFEFVFPLHVMCTLFFFLQYALFFVSFWQILLHRANSKLLVRCKFPALNKITVMSEGSFKWEHERVRARKLISSTGILPPLDPEACVRTLPQLPVSSHPRIAPG